MNYPSPNLSPKGRETLIESGLGLKFTPVEKELSKLIKKDLVSKVKVKVIFLMILLTLWGCGVVSKKAAKNESKAEAKSEAKSEKAVSEIAEERPEDKVAKLTLQTPKNEYSSGEAIPLNATLKVGDFDLKVPKFSIEDQTLLSKIEVKFEDGSIIPPLKVLVESQKQSQYLEGRLVSTKAGVELKRAEEVNISTNNLLKYYDIKKPGKYALQCGISLEVYREVVEERPRRVRELESEIAEIQRNTKLPEESKAAAIQSLREEIQDELANYKGTRQKFVVLESYRGKAEIKSNIVEVAIK